DALGQATALAPKNIDILLLYGRTLRSVSENRQTPQSIAVMRQVLALEPNNLEALFLVGREEVNAGRTTQGKALMQKALDQIPPGAKERVELQKQIEALGEKREKK
ncbi:MAG: tetratricopeptide repeat protein, partial [Alphaproteobacteria bacterium]